MFIQKFLYMTLLFMFALVGTVRAGELELTPPDIARATLANGLEVVVIPDRRAPVATHMMWYKAGSADEPRGKSGIAHFLEHLMFKGTKNTPAGEFSRKVAEIGGQENAFTTVDFTAYYQKIPPDALEMVMTYEADRMENLVLTSEVIEPEKNVILEERRSRVDSEPGAILGEVEQATLFKHHPYGTPIIGWQNEMLSLTKEDALAFYERFYSPNNAILVVAGDVDTGDVMELAERVYGKVARRTGDVIRVRVREPEPVAARTVEYADERVSRPTFRRTYLVPSYQRAEPGEAEAIEILADILGGSSTSRIYTEIVIGREIATSAGAWYQSAALDLTKFAVYGTPRGDEKVETVMSAIDAVIEKLVTDGVSEAEVERSRNNLIKSVVFERDSQTSMARLYGTVLALGGNLEDIDQWPDRLSRVTAEDVNAVARKYLRKSRSVTSFLRPQS